MNKTGVAVKLLGEDGNAFAIIGKTARELKRAGFRAEASEFTAQAFAAANYDEVLRLVMEYVEVE